MPSKCEPDVAELKRLRREGLAMDEIADHMGFHRATLYRYLRASLGLHPRKNDNHQRGEEDVWR